MRTFRSAFVLVVASLSAFVSVAENSAAQASTLSAPDQAAYTDAIGLFRQQRYAAAYGRFSRLADLGHVESARFALLMYTNGAALFANDWFAAPNQQRHWHALVAAAEQQPYIVADTRGTE